MDALKILTIGNSFTDSLTRYFKQVVESAGCGLTFDRANFGGCELARHWSYVEAEKNNPLCRVYQGGKRLCDILEREPWDIVTIQQASHDSWRPETFQPYADNLIGYVGNHAPQAEVVIQQTWAYRADHPQFLPGSPWGISQQQMYDQLTANYRKLGAECRLRIIPTGFAVELTRRNGKVKFQNYDPALIDTLNWPDLPPQAGDVVGKSWWDKNPATGELKICRDLIHLNLRGEYLLECVWFAFLYNRPVSEVKFVPDEIGGGDAAFLRETAQLAVDTFQPEEKN